MIEETKNNLDLQHYEMMYIIPTVFAEDKIKEVIKNISSQITTVGGIIVKEENIGLKKLAYKIKHQHTGHYVLLEFDVERSQLAGLEQKFRLSDEILRHLIVKFTPKTEEDIVREKDVAKRIEAKKKKEIVKEIEEIKEKDKEEAEPAPEVNLPEEKKKEKKEDKKASLEDLDKKLDEILDEDVEI